MYWILVVVGLGALGWLWWQSVKPPEPEPSPPPPMRPTAKRTPPALPRQTTGTNVLRETKPSVPPASSNPPPVVPVEPGKFVARPAQTPLEAQLALGRRGISCGSLDGVLGSQTRTALRVFQREEHLPVTGELDEKTREQLLLTEPPLTHYVITPEDLARLHWLPHTWLGKSQQTQLDYETVLELVAEKAHSHPDLIRKLNPELDWKRISAGTSVQVPDAGYPAARRRAALVKIFLGSKTLEAFDARSNLLAHFPCSIAAQVQKRPRGELEVTIVVHHPNYVFNPDVFPESEEGRRLGRKLVLPAGPNNPVGTAWIGLNKSGYGIHGTPRPEDVGRTESHGCFRLANWNAEYLAQLVSVGMPVQVEP